MALTSPVQSGFHTARRDDRACKRAYVNATLPGHLVLRLCPPPKGALPVPVSSPHLTSLTASQVGFTPPSSKHLLTNHRAIAANILFVRFRIYSRHLLTTCRLVKATSWPGRFTTAESHYCKTASFSGVLYFSDHWTIGLYKYIIV